MNVNIINVFMILILLYSGIINDTHAFNTLASSTEKVNDSTVETEDDSKLFRGYFPYVTLFLMTTGALTGGLIGIGEIKARCFSEKCNDGSGVSNFFGYMALGAIAGGGIGFLIDYAIYKLFIINNSSRKQIGFSTIIHIGFTTESLYNSSIYYRF